MRQFLENVTGLSIYPMISLVLFGLIFLFSLVRVWLMDNSLVQEMRNLPLDKDSIDN